MKKSCFLTLLLAVLWPASASAQGLSAVPFPDELKAGTLPNGLHYFIVSNPASAGFADYALIQPGIDGRIDRIPFLESKGVGYGKRGVTNMMAGARIISFRDVPATTQPERDSTLLMLLDFVWQSPFEQTVIISGDLDIAKTERALEVMNLTVPVLLPSETRKPESKSAFTTFCEPEGRLVRVGARYSVQMPDPENRNTPILFVTELLLRELANILENRMEAAFKAAGIPYACLESDFEQGITSLYADRSDAAGADSLFRLVVRTLGEEGVSAGEITTAHSLCVPSVVRSALRKGEPNAAYVRKCVDATLYGLPIVSSGTVRNFFNGKKLDDVRQQALFNSFLRSLLMPEDSEILRTEVRRGPAMDSLRIGGTTGKCKPKTQTVEPVSGGQLWTFSNGIKVAYRKVDDIRGRFSYAFMLRGGMTIVPGLADGEAPYVADILDLSTVQGGTPGPEFKRILAREGISMSQNVTMSDFRITGTAPSDKLSTLMDAVYTLAYYRKPDSAAFDFFRRCEAVESGLSPDRLSLIDSLACPDNPFLSRKNPEAIRDDLQDRAEAYFDARFSNFADGLIVLAGDLEEEKVKSVLESSLSMFRTSKRYASRSLCSYPLRSGTTVLHQSGKEEREEVCMGFLADTTLNASSYASLLVTRNVLLRYLNNSLAMFGASFDVKVDREIYPNERIKMYISARPLPEESLPEGVSPSGLEELHLAVTKAIGDFTQVNPLWLENAKKSVLGDVEVGNSRSSEMTVRILSRYADGKDFYRNFRQAVGAVGESDVLSVVNTLSGGARIDLLISSDKK